MVSLLGSNSKDYLSATLHKIWWFALLHIHLGRFIDQVEERHCFHPCGLTRLHKVLQRPVPIFVTGFKIRSLFVKFTKYKSESTQ